MNWRAPVIRLALRLTDPEVLREIALIESLERASPDKVRDFQQKRLERLLHHAWRHTDYYRDVLESCGAVRDGKVNLDRFEDIPFLTKDIIRKQGERLWAHQMPDGRRAHMSNSSGTTGEPIRFQQDNVHWAVNIGTRIYQFGVLGKRLGDREMKIWGHEGDLTKGTRGVRARVENFVYNRKFQGAWYLSKERMKEIVDEINLWRPQFLWCFRDGIDAVAKYINSQGLSVHQPGAIVLGGSTVYPFVVKTIEQAFHAPVLSAYGSREVGGVACECLEKMGHHIATNFAVIEAIDVDGRPVMEQDAELAITGLMSYAMPFIRYRLGDRGSLTKRLCACGRTFPLLGSISGRVVEAFVNSRDEQVDPMYFIMLFRTSWDAGALGQFQIVQELDRSLTINLVPEVGFTGTSIGFDYAEITRKIRLVMGEDCVVRFELVKEIPLSASGKFPYIVRRH
ncbi:MAG: phenylacetate--CoA ligase family protein [Steroidobacteraceae bacterium]|jgi:phenylacetate-CoA ligase